MTNTVIRQSSEPFDDQATAIYLNIANNSNYAKATPRQIGMRVSTSEGAPTRPVVSLHHQHEAFDRRSEPPASERSSMTAQYDGGAGLRFGSQSIQ
jgi:hypothetical protein